MIIKRENYEVFFIDYLDGNLSAKEVDELFLFLKNNPDLAMELEGLESVVLQQSNKEFKGKKSLFKSSISEIEGIGDLDYLCIADLEGDITENQTQALNHIFETEQNSRSTRAKYNRIKLIPDQNEVYKGKAKHKRIGILNIQLGLLKNIGTVAASVAIVIGVFSILSVLRLENAIQVAENSPTVIQIDENPTEKVIDQKHEISIEPIKINNPSGDKANTVVQINQTQSFEAPIVIKAKMIDNNEKVEAIKSLSAQKLEINLLAQNSLNIDHFDFNDKIQHDVNQRIGSKRTIGIFDLAQLGIDRLSKATGGNIKLEADKSIEGEIKKIHFETDLFALSVPINRRKNR